MIWIEMKETLFIPKPASSLKAWLATGKTKGSLRVGNASGISHGQGFTSVFNLYKCHPPFTNAQPHALLSFWTRCVQCCAKHSWWTAVAPMKCHLHIWCWWFELKWKKHCSFRNQLHPIPIHTLVSPNYRSFWSSKAGNDWDRCTIVATRLGGACFHWCNKRACLLYRSQLFLHSHRPRFWISAKHLLRWYASLLAAACRTICGITQVDLYFNEAHACLHQCSRDAKERSGKSSPLGRDTDFIQHRRHSRTHWLWPKSPSKMESSDFPVFVVSWSSEGAKMTPQCEYLRPVGGQICPALKPKHSEGRM